MKNRNVCHKKAVDRGSRGVMMGFHWDVDLEVSFENAEQAERFSRGLKYDEEDNTCVRFELDGDGEAIIAMGNLNGKPSFFDNKIDLFGECSIRFVGFNNAEDSSANCTASPRRREP